jgi:hypothetical protein
MYCVAIESSYRLNVLRTARSLAIEHVPEAAQCPMKAGGWHERVTGSEFNVNRFAHAVGVVEEKIRVTRINRIYGDELESLRC